MLNQGIGLCPRTCLGCGEMVERDKAQAADHTSKYVRPVCAVLRKNKNHGGPDVC
jgi:hypothetical protein